MKKRELQSLIAELQSVEATLTDDNEFDICVSDANDNCYEVVVGVNRMDLNENCKMDGDKPYPAELCITLDNGFYIGYNREEA